MRVRCMDEFDLKPFPRSQAPPPGTKPASLPSSLGGRLQCEVSSDRLWLLISPRARLQRVADDLGGPLARTFRRTHIKWVAAPPRRPAKKSAKSCCWRPTADIRRGSLRSPEIEPSNVPRRDKRTSLQSDQQPTLPGVAQHKIGSFSAHGRPGANGTAFAKINQDRGLVTYPFNDDPNSAFFAVFDGHGMNGEQVSEYAIWKVQEIMMLNCSMLPHKAEQCMIHAFEEGDKQLAKSPRRREGLGHRGRRRLCPRHHARARAAHTSHCPAITRLTLSLFFLSACAVGGQLRRLSRGACDRHHEPRRLEGSQRDGHPSF